MSRRRKERDAGVGSDSFLDIVANIVGILIILIVVVGVRVSQAPLVKPQPEAVAAAVPPPAAVVEPVPSVAPEPVAPEPVVQTPSWLDSPPVATLEPASPPPVAEEIEPELPVLPAPAPPAELTAETQRIARELEQLKQQRDKRRADAVALAQQYASSKEKLFQLSETSRIAESRIDDRVQAIAAAQEKSAALEAEVGQLLAEVEELDPPEEAPAVLEHSVNPIGRVVKGEELHFRVLNGRVAEVPLAPLIEELKDRIQSRKEWLIKHRHHAGTVGPIGGFSMRYVVERQGGSALDELRYGRGVYRIGVTGWQIIPESDAIGETAAQALASVSAFRQSLALAGSSTTVTFWVYPDSFDLFRELQSAARDQGLRVAGRPLPHDVPISGSPNGSRSVGQ